MTQYLKTLILFLPFVLTARPLEYEAAPVDNPLKGLVPYASEEGKGERFPHSMEFRYFAMSDFFKARDRFDWAILEDALEQARKGGRQLVFRVYLEYPGKKSGLPEFLIKEGVAITKWGRKGENLTPDYESRVLRRALADFIKAMGRKFDGDPRVGFITAGLLGKWGEWHNYPRKDLEASKEVQEEVMRAYSESFVKTHVLLRYPAGADDWSYADNRKVKMGYHDDSFAWSTIPRPGESDEWFFVSKLRKAGVVRKWKMVPIGGEIRPEIWATTFTGQTMGQQQDFRSCVEETHVSWLMDSGMFSDQYPVNEERRNRAMKEVSRMGYELHLSKAEVKKGRLQVTVENRGVAPFYYDWPVELRVGEIMNTRWKLSEVLPGKPVVWSIALSGDGEVFIRVSNPMKGGRDLKFANAGYRDGWLRLR